MYKHSENCRNGGIGRHEGLKIPWPQGCAGSSPARGTTLFSPLFLISFFLLLAPCSLLLTSCGTRSGHFKIEGRFLHINQGELYVYSPDGGIRGMDTIKIQAGRFAYETPMADDATLILVFPNYSEHPVFAKSGASVEVKADASHLKEMTVGGTDENKLMTRFRRNIMNASPPQEKKLAQEFIEEHPESRVSIYLLEKYFLKTQTPDYIGAQKLLKEMTAQQPDNTRLLALSHQVAALSTSLVGARLPKISAVDTEGRTVTSASLSKGVAVISVWGSWNYESLDIQRTLRDIKEEAGDKLRLLSICIDASKNNCKQQMDGNRITWSNICDEKMMEGRLLQQLGLMRPADNIVLVNGKVTDRELSNSELRDKLKTLIP